MPRPLGLWPGEKHYKEAGFQAAFQTVKGETRLHLAAERLFDFIDPKPLRGRGVVYDHAHKSLRAPNRGGVDVSRWLISSALVLVVLSLAASGVTYELMNRRVTSLRQDVASLSTVKTTIGSLESRLSASDAARDGLARELAGLKQELSTLQQDLGTLGGSLATAIGSRLADLETRVNALDQCVSDLTFELNNGPGPLNLYGATCAV